jgi:hypothetical protein
LPNLDFLLKEVKGNGMTLGVTDGTLFGGTYSQNGGTNSGCFQISQGDFGGQIGTSSSDSSFNNGKLIGITTDSSKSGIIVEINLNIHYCIKF